MKRWIALAVVVLGCGAFFCAERFVSASKGRSRQSTDVTYAKDIAPILFNNCVTCHRPGEVAPFSLLNYEDASKRASLLAAVTQSRYMPPWKPEPGHGDFIGEMRLTDEQIGLIKKWADAGAPEGDPQDLPEAPKFAEGWLLGEPDLVLEMPEAFTVRADGPDIFQCFVLPTNLPEDTYISAFEFRPGTPAVVHHSLVAVDTTGKARQLDEADPDVGYQVFGGFGFTPTGDLGGWAPGAFPQRLADGIAKQVPRNADIVVQTHFHPTGKIEAEKSKIGLYFSKAKPTKLAINVPFGTTRIEIPANEKAHKIRASAVIPIDIDLNGVTPHAHLLCRQMLVTATYPNGKKESLIFIKDWDFNWQGQYKYKSPVKLPRGTRIEMEYVYDNSEENFRNPNIPPKRVTFGEQTNDEMAFCFLEVLVNANLVPTLSRTFPAKRSLTH